MTPALPPRNLFYAPGAETKRSMKDLYVRDLAANQTINSSFLVREKTLRSRRNDPTKVYLSIKLGDRTGEIEGRVWDNADRLTGEFQAHDVIRVSGKVELYQGTKQLNIRSLQLCPTAEVDPADFLPSTSQDVDRMYAGLLARVKGFNNEWLRKLLLSLLEDPELAGRIKLAPAAMMMHHAYVGGLLEHITSLVELARRIADHYPALDEELLECGAILHDIGKLYELEYSRSLEYSTRGRLVGHMAIGLEILREKISVLGGFPSDLRYRLEHMILSHHGEYELGSPVLPAFPEALALHLMDQLDSKLQSMDAQYERDQELPGDWTDRNRALRRILLKPAAGASSARKEKGSETPNAQPGKTERSSNRWSRPATVK